jgi:hypothetical protein
MMKKTFFVFVLATFVVGGIFAMPEFRFSIGAGGFFTSDFGGGVEASVSGFGNIGNIKTPYAGGGGFVFLDATFVEFSLGFFGIGGTWEEKEYVTISNAKYDFSGAGLDIGLLGKYPFVISEQLTLFPFLGISYRTIFSVKLDGKKSDDPGDLSALWFKFGGGLDYYFTEKIFLRAGILYGIRLSNEFEKDMVNIFKSLGSQNSLRVNAETLLGHGIDIKLAIGFRI